MSTFRQKILVIEQFFLVFIYFLDVIISGRHSNHKSKTFIVVYILQKERFFLVIWDKMPSDFTKTGNWLCNFQINKSLFISKII